MTLLFRSLLAIIATLLLSPFINGVHVIPNFATDEECDAVLEGLPRIMDVVDDIHLKTLVPVRSNLLNRMRHYQSYLPSDINGNDETETEEFQFITIRQTSQPHRDTDEAGEMIVVVFLNDNPDAYLSIENFGRQSVEKGTLVAFEGHRYYNTVINDPRQVVHLLGPMIIHDLETNTDSVTKRRNLLRNR